MNYEVIIEAASFVRRATDREEHDVAAVLGSGLGSYAAGLQGAHPVSYAEIPGFPQPGVEGHSGTLYSVEVDSTRLLLFSGRSHLYEGWEMEDVVFGVRTAIAAGCSSILLTNAAGGVGSHLEPGDLVLITDHINLTGRNPLFGENDQRLGHRFPDMSSVYDPNLRAFASATGSEVDVTLKEGVYAWMTGPSYETPAEIEMVRTLGGDLVGMSTVPEAIAARHMGARVLGISLVTNLAAGISPTPLSHEEVQETAEAARARFTRLLDALLPRLK